MFCLGTGKRAVNSANLFDFALTATEVAAVVAAALLAVGEPPAAEVLAVARAQAVVAVPVVEVLAEWAAAVGPPAFPPDLSAAVPHSAALA